MPALPVSYTPRPYVRGGSIGELLRLSGRNSAEAELRAGEIQARMWSDLGQTIAGSINSYAKERQDAPIRAQEAEARTITIENARAEQAASRKATEDKAILGSAQGSRLSPDAVKEQLSALGRGDLIPVFDKTWTDLESARVGLKTKQAELAGHEADYFGALAAGLKKAKFDPMAVEWALKEAEADGHDVTQLKQQLQQNPQMLPTLADQLIEKSPTQRKLAGEEADRALKTQQEQRAIRTAEQTAADRLEDNRRATETAAEAARHNRATEAHAAATDSAAPALSTAGLDQAARRYLTDGTLPPMGMGGKGAAVRTTIINRAAALDPDANIAGNKADFQANQGALAQMQKQRDAIGAFEQTAMKNIDIFLEQSKKVIDTGSPLLNSPLRLVTGKVLGAPDQAAYDAARQVAVNEIAKITSNPTLSGQLSDSARHEVDVFNPQNATLKQSIAVMKLLKRDMENRTKSLDEQLATIRGRIRGGQTPSETTPITVGGFTVTVGP